MTHPTNAGLDALFAPRSIAVIGASSNPEKVAGLPVRFLREFGYQGRIFPVNPTSAEIQGLRAYENIAAVGQPVDLAILSLPASATVKALDDCGRAGVRAAVLFASGFAELGAEGAREQERLQAVAQQHGKRVLGPNCLGMMNVNTGAYATFSPLLHSGALKPGNVAVVSGSGAFGVFALVRARERGIGISLFASTGNEADVDLAECIRYLAEDEQTKVIACYMEGARDGERLAAALELARLHRKPVIVCKSGTSAMGGATAASHTAALAGADEIFDAVFRQHGAYRARDVDEMFDVAYACSVSPLPRSRRLGILSMSGGAAVSLADAAERFHMEVPTLPEPLQQRILERVPHGSASGPIDLTGKVLDDHSIFPDVVDEVVNSGTYDSVVAFQAVTGITPQHRSFITGTWSTVRERHPELPVAVVSVFDDENRRFLDGIGCMAFEEPTRAVRALAALAGLREVFDRSAPTHERPASMPLATPMDRSERQALALVAKAGIPVVPHATACDARQAADAATAMGFPVVLKVLSDDIPHKSDAGRVALRLREAEEVKNAFENILQRVRQARPDATIDGVLVAPMIQGGVECILGGLVDPVFGPVVMFGLGGIHVEVLKDVSFRRAPLDRAEAYRMVREIRSAAVLDGVRGQPPVDQQALADALVRLSHLIVANVGHVASIEINPFIALPHGGMAVDALVVPLSAPEA